MRGAVAEQAFTVALPGVDWVVRVDPRLRRDLSGLADELLTVEVQRIMRLYFNTGDGDGLAAQLRDVRATARQGGWEPSALLGIASGEVLEDPGYFDVATLGPLPDEPAPDGACRYLLAGVRVWLDPELSPDGRPEMWLTAADPAEHTRLDRALRPRHPRRPRYMPADRTTSWPFSAIVDPTLHGFD